MNLFYSRFQWLFLVWSTFSFLTVANASQVTSSINLKLGEATYSGIYEDAITLKNGRWIGQPFVAGGASRPMVELVDGFYLRGDLDGDGLEEYVAMLKESSGGSGTQYYLAVMRLQAGRLVNLSTAFIGDRIKIQGGHILNGQIELEMIQHGEMDPACCPTQKTTQIWRLDGRCLKLKDLVF